MRFIREFQKRGTLLFVSHDTAAVQNLCESAIWLSHGKVRMIGTSREISESYLQFTLQEVYGDEAKLISVGSDQPKGGPASQTSGMDPHTAPIVDYGAVASVQDNTSAAVGWKTGRAAVS